MDVESRHDMLCQKIFLLLRRATDNQLNGEDISSETEFTQTGMNSIEYLRLIDLVETTFDVTIDLVAEKDLNSVGKFVKVLLKQGVVA